MFIDGRSSEFTLMCLLFTSGLFGSLYAIFYKLIDGTFDLLKIVFRSFLLDLPRLILNSITIWLRGYDKDDNNIGKI
jgi:hypothetical protein